MNMWSLRYASQNHDHGWPAAHTNLFCYSQRDKLVQLHPLVITTPMQPNLANFA